MKYISLFSGIEAATAAWHSLGWTPICFAEIEAFPSAVLAFHYPSVPNVGDMTKHDWAQHHGQCDLVVAGAPCQAFSVAGLRESLNDSRGNLTLETIKAVHAINPEWFIFENVPGILSTDDNAFGCFLAGLVGASEPIVPRTSDGRWTGAGVVCGPRRAAAWRILDAQYVAVAGDSSVPQRRARVFVLSRHFGNLGGLETSSPERNADRVCGLLAEILFESESLPRHSAPCRETGSRVASTLTRGAESSGRGGYAGRRREDDSNIVVNAIDAHMGMAGPDDNAAQVGHLIAANNFGEMDVATCLSAKNERLDGDTETFIVSHALRADGFDASEDGTGRGTPIIAVHPHCIGRAPTAGPQGKEYLEDGSAYTMDSRGVAQAVTAPIPTGYQGDRLVTDGMVWPALPANGGNNGGGGGAIYVPTVPFAFEPRIARNGRGQPSDVSPSLKAADAGIHADAQPHVATRYGVRRITPTEAERLQGFPDGFTAITYKGKPAADGPRYKALGNSMCVKVMHWLGVRINRGRAVLAQCKRGAA